MRKIIDIVIGTLCIANGLTLRKDRDFSPMEKHLGLMVNVS